MRGDPADVVVIGGGVSGCATAYALARSGATVLLLDAHTPGRATSASAGGLWAVGESLGLGCGVILQEREAGEGPDPGPQPVPPVFMDFLMRSNRRFPRLAEELRELTGIDVEAEAGQGLLYLLYDEAQERHADRILAWLDSRSEAPGLAELWSPERVHEREPHLTRELRGAVHFPGDSQVNPMALAEALKCGAHEWGGRFFSEARVTGFETEGDRVVAVETERGTFACGAVVDAAGAWSGRLMERLGASLPVFPVRGQIVCTEALAPTLRGSLSTADCYLLQKAHGEVLIGSTTERTDFEPAVEIGELRRLAAGARRAVPALAHAGVKRTWAGLRPGTPDELPVLGPAREFSNLFHATGGFRTGIVAAPLAGELVAACVLDRELPFPIEPFLASRFQRPAPARRADRRAARAG